MGQSAGDENALQLAAREHHWRPRGQRPEVQGSQEVIDALANPTRRPAAILQRDADLSGDRAPHSGDLRSRGVGENPDLRRRTRTQRKARPDDLSVPSDAATEHVWCKT